MVSVHTYFTTYMRTKIFMHQTVVLFQILTRARVSASHFHISIYYAYKFTKVYSVPQLNTVTNDHEKLQSLPCYELILDMMDQSGCDVPLKVNSCVCV